MDNYIQFRTMITPTLMSLLYVLGTLLLTFGGIVLLVQGKWTEGSEALAFNVVWRLLCEVMVVLFSIHKSLGSLDKTIGGWRKDWLKR